MKCIVFDASTLISFSMNGLIDEFRNLKKIFPGKFIITKEVKREIIDNPIKIKRFELEALRTKQLLEEGIIEMPEVLGISHDEISKETFNFLGAANSIFNSKNKEVNIIHDGEASCIALSKILNNKKIPNVMAIDERTTRMLIEKPGNLKNLLEKKLHTKIFIEKDNFEMFKGFNIIRSAELIYLAFKNNLVKLKDGNLVLDALLYSLKFKGCSISDDEIEEIKKIG